VLVIVERVNESNFDDSHRTGDRRGIDADPDDAIDEQLGAPESALVTAEVQDQSDRDQNVGDDGPAQPEAWQYITDVVEVFNLVRLG